ncbi:MAG: hypothetical protein KDA91_01160 [Planctomycetaceae bacterium]|nr:hypothetical protein [Planctomycetaceae bacterium]
MNLPLRPGELRRTKPGNNPSNPVESGRCFTLLTTGETNGYPGLSASTSFHGTFAAHSGKAGGYDLQPLPRYPFRHHLFARTIAVID